MKKELFGFCLGAMAACLLIASCDESDGESAPVPALTVSASVTADAGGGQYSAAYSIDDPADNGYITLSCDVTWLSGLTDTGNGTITFTLDENTTSQLRTGNITVIYNWSDGYSLEKVGVIQYGTQTPELSVQPTVIVAYGVGQDCSFHYTVDNPVSNGVFDCTTDADWIVDFDYTEYGTVNFTVEANETEELRSADINVTYTYGRVALSKIVAVVQDYSETADSDFSDVVGTWEISAQVMDPNVSNGVMDATWTLKVFLDESTDGYDLYLDGICYQYAGAYDLYGDHRCSARAFYRNGGIIIPSQVISSTYQTQNGVKYYFGYTACLGYSDEGFYTSKEWPDVVFSFTGATTMESDYGVMSTACTSALPSSMEYITDTSVPPVTITKISASTDAVTVSSFKGLDFTPLHATAVLR